MPDKSMPDKPKPEKPMPGQKSFISYQNRNPKYEDIIYGTLNNQQIIGKRKATKQIWLGRVIDKDNRIFFTRALGYYHLTINNEFRTLEGEELETIQNMDNCQRAKKGTVKKAREAKKRSMVHIGAPFIIYSYIIKEKLDSFFSFTSDQERDSILSLIIYRICERTEYSFAQEWYKNNIIRYLCPHAKLQTEQISELLARLSSVKFCADFYANYLGFIKNIDNLTFTLIDSTYLPEGIPYTYSVNNYFNSFISSNLRLIILLDRKSGLPTYYKNLRENIGDGKPFDNFLSELSELDIYLNTLILDSGYYSEEDIKAIYDTNIPFMMRIFPKTSFYNSLLQQYATNIVDIKNYVKYRHRILFIKKHKITLFDGLIPIFAYICYDGSHLNLLEKGFFIILSTINFTTSEVLLHYYNRQSVDQFFDYLNNNLNFVPSPADSQDVLNGSLMLSFISTVIFTYIDNKLKENDLSLSNSLFSLRSLLGIVSKNTIIPSIPTKKVNDVLKALKISLPNPIFIEAP
jgi:hypothetical protein